MAKKKVVEPEVQEPQAALVAEMDALDYAPGAAPSSTTTPEAPVAAEAAPEVPPETPLVEEPAVEEPAAPPVEEPVAAAEPVAVAPTEPPAVEPPKAKTPEEKLEEVQALQVAHYQRLYEDAKEKLRELEAKAAPIAVEPEAPPPLTQEEIRRAYEPEIKRVTEAGYLPEAFVEDFPDVAAQMLYHRDMLYEARKELKELRTWAQQTIGQQRTSAADNHLNTLLDEVALMGSHLEPLKDGAVRNAFREYLNRVNPMCNQENIKEVLAQQYLAFNHQAVMAALGATATPAPTGGSPVGVTPAPAVAPKLPPQNLTMGEHGGTRAGGRPPQQKDPFLAEMDALDF